MCVHVAPRCVVHVFMSFVALRNVVRAIYEFSCNVPRTYTLIKKAERWEGFSLYTYMCTRSSYSFQMHVDTHNEGEQRILIKQDCY